MCVLIYKGKPTDKQTGKMSRLKGKLKGWQAGETGKQTGKHLGRSTGTLKTDRHVRQLGREVSKLADKQQACGPRR